MTLTHTETRTTEPKTVHEIPSIDIDIKDESLSEKILEHDSIEEEPYKMEIVWPSVIVFFMMHLGAIYGVYLSLFQAKFLTLVYGIFMIFVTNLSITIGAHRYYSHRSFKINKSVNLILMLLHTMTGQRSLLTWIRDHRTHHKYSDTDADPHNSSRGFFFSHIGWLLVRRHPKVIKKGKTINVSDAEQDPIIMFQKRHYLKLFFIINVIFSIIIPGWLWNETIWNSFFINFAGRMVGCWNSTWLVNSYTHLYGNKPYTKDISPGENPIVSLIIMGEGMHNYHHTFPWDYRGAEHNNISTRVIDYWIKMGWAYDTKSVSSELVKRHAMKKGDGSHPIYSKLNPNGVPVSENY